MAQFHYLDSSAIVKLAIHEAESKALRQFLRTRSVRATSRLSWAEVARAVRRAEPTALPTAQRVLARFEAIEVTSGLVTAAAGLDPVELRTIDAIHIASAARLVPDLMALLTYDQRMVTAAVAVGLPVVSPR
jgi:uncharacterized protein